MKECFGSTRSQVRILSPRLGSHEIGNKTERALSEDLLYLAILGIVKPYILKNPRIKFFKVIAIKILKDYIFDPFLLI